MTYLKGVGARALGRPKSSQATAQAIAPAHLAGYVWRCDKKAATSDQLAGPCAHGSDTHTDPRDRYRGFLTHKANVKANTTLGVSAKRSQKDAWTESPTASTVPEEAPTRGTWRDAHGLCRRPLP